MSCTKPRNRIPYRFDLDALDGFAVSDLVAILAANGLGRSVRREGITWTNLTADTVQFDIEVENPLGIALPDDTLVVEAAPFGAFLGWKPLTRVAVGAMEPGEKRRVRFTAPAAKLPLGWAAPNFQAHHWIGNVKVCFASQPELAVERHFARQVAVPAGVKSRCLIMVFGGDTYTTGLVGPGPDWRASLTESAEIEALRNALGIEDDMRPTLLGFDLFIEAPGVASRTYLKMEITRTRDGLMVPVEFDLVSRLG